MNKNQNTQFKHVIIIRWIARIIGLLLFILFALLFYEDGFPFYLFRNDPLHMTALSISLIGLLVGWKSDFWAGVIILAGTIADWIVVSIPTGMLLPHMGPLVSFFPFIGLMFLYCWWRKKLIHSSE